MNKFFYIRKPDSNSLDKKTMNILRSLVNKGLLSEEVTRNLRHRGTPVAVVATKVVGNTVSFAVSTHLPKDRSNKSLGREVAEARLAGNKSVLTTTVEGKLTAVNVFKAVLSCVSNSNQVPVRTRKYAGVMLEIYYSK